MLVEIPLTEAERAAVEDGENATQRLIERLADIPTPAGPTPRTIAARGADSVVATPASSPSRGPDMPRP